MRLSATKALLEHRDCIIVATVSSIYGLGDPAAYHAMVLHLVRGETIDQRFILRRLAELQYARNEVELHRGTYRVRGEVIDVYPAESERDAVRIELFDDEIENLSWFDPLTGEVVRRVPRLTVYPKSHYVTPRERVLEAIEEIKVELRDRLAALRADNRLVEAQRLEQRTRFDIEMMTEIGHCKGIENYSRFPVGTPSRRAAADPVRLSSGRRAALHRREPRDRPPARRNVPWRPLPQGNPGRVRVPASVGARQPAAAVRRVRANGSADRLRVGDAGAHTRSRMRARWWSRWCVLPGWSTRELRYGVRRRRSTICSRRSTAAPPPASGYW